MTATSAVEELAPNAEILSGVVPYLMVDGAVKAGEFYTRAFGATVVRLHPVDDKGRTMHVHLHLNGGSLMLSDGYPEHGHPIRPHQGFNLFLSVAGLDAWWARAVAAGAEIVMPLQDMFWGERYGQLRDPFGVTWGLSEKAR